MDSEEARKLVREMGQAMRMEWGVEQGSSEEEVEEAIRVLEQSSALPDPAGGCACTPFDQDAGGGYVEHLLEYDPACPVHSTHVYFPRAGAWVLVDHSTEYGYRLPDGREEWEERHSDGSWTTQHARDGIMLEPDRSDSLQDMERQLDGRAVLIHRGVALITGPAQP